MRKTAFFICENKDADQLHSNNTTDQRLRFPCIDSTLNLHVLFNLKFQASNHLLWLYSPACVAPGRKPHRLMTCLFDTDWSCVFVMFNEKARVGHRESKAQYGNLPCV